MMTNDQDLRYDGQMVYYYSVFYFCDTCDTFPAIVEPQTPTTIVSGGNYRAFPGIR